MKDYSEIMENSKKIHAQKFNCAQSVLCSLSGYTGLDDATSKAVSAGFGGGLRCGEACGAITGAVMALGLATVKDGKGSKDSPIADKTRKFIEEFTAKFDTVRCEDLLEAAGGHEQCDDFISYCAQLAAAIIDEDEESDNK